MARSIAVVSSKMKTVFLWLRSRWARALTPLTAKCFKKREAKYETNFSQPITGHSDFQFDFGTGFVQLCAEKAGLEKTHDDHQACGSTRAGRYRSESPHQRHLIE